LVDIFYVVFSEGMTNCVKGGVYGLVATAVLMLGPTALTHK